MVNSAYLKNHGGMKLSDEEMKDIPNPRLELITHVTIKDVQAFGLLGTLLIGPTIAVARKSSRNAEGLLRLSRKSGLVGAVLGLAAGPAMSIGRMKSLNDDEVYDRCYRLRCNRNQVRVDQASIVGGAAGAVAGVFSGGSLVYGGLLGMSAGILGAAAFNAKHGNKHT